MDTSSIKNNRIDILQPTRNLPFLHRLIRLLTHPMRIPGVIKNHFMGIPKVIEWDSRAEGLGAYSVIDTRHSPSEYEYVTKRQKEILYPLFLQQLNGREKNILDFGCGPGRFTGDLAELIKGEAIGTDITKKLIDLAPPHPKVNYIHSKSFFAENSAGFDAIWISLILGGIPDDKVHGIADNLSCALNKGGLLFLVESTGESPTEGLWRIRTREALISFFPSIQLKHIGSYFDAGQEISVIAGRKYP